MKKILVILGPTATGKSDLAVKLAKKYNGEIISADSRQVYKGLDIGTGKITKKEMQGVPHYMLDIISPKKTYTVAEWQKETKKIITLIHSRAKLPIICGGTGLYIQSIVDGIIFPEVPPNNKLRKNLETKSLKYLVTLLQKLDTKRAKNIDLKNKVRLIRAIEIVKAIGKVPVIKKSKNEYDILQIGLILEPNELRKKINMRFDNWIKKGIINETKKLKENGLSWKKIRGFGLEYSFIVDFLQKKNYKKEMLTKSKIAIWRYSRRQITWFKRDKRIKWFFPSEKTKINSNVRNFLTLK